MRALLPFIYHEPELAIVASAVLMYFHGFTLGPVPIDHMFAARMLWLAVSSSGNQTAAAGVAQAIYLLGTEESRPLLDQVWCQAGREEFAILLRARSGTRTIHKATVDFLVDKLSDLQATGDKCLFNIVAAALGNLVEGTLQDRVYEIERQIPVFLIPDLAPDQQPQGVRFVRAWSIAEYGQIIASQLRALADKEPEPKLIPIIARNWRVSS